MRLHFPEGDNFDGDGLAFITVTGTLVDNAAEAAPDCAIESITVGPNSLLVVLRRRYSAYFGPLIGGYGGISIGTGLLLRTIDGLAYDLLRHLEIYNIRISGRRSTKLLKVGAWKMKQFSTTKGVNHPHYD